MDRQGSELDLAADREAEAVLLAGEPPRTVIERADRELFAIGFYLSTHSLDVYSGPFGRQLRLSGTRDESQSRFSRNLISMWVRLREKRGGGELLAHPPSHLGAFTLGPASARGSMRG